MSDLKNMIDCDRSFLAGMRHGWNLANCGLDEEYRKLEERMLAEIREARKELDFLLEQEDLPPDMQKVLGANLSDLYEE